MKNQITTNDNTTKADKRWSGLYRAASVAMLVMFGLIVAQIIVYSIWQPPAEIESMLLLMQNNWLLGLLSMDLLYLADCVLLAIIYLALFLRLHKHGESAMLIATALGLLGIAAYFSTNPAFEMLYLGRAYMPDITQQEKITILAAGRGFMESYRGTAFNVYYVLNTIYLFITSAVMHKSRLFGRASVICGFTAALFMIIPASAETIGLIFSLASLLPWMGWLLLVSLRFRRFARNPAQ